MANTIIHKRSSTPTKVPLAGDLVAGEIAINSNDGLLFVKNDAGTVLTVNPTIDKAFVDALNVDADTLDGIDSTGFATSAHNHDADYLGLTATAANSQLLDGIDSTGFATAAQGTKADNALPATNGVSTGMYETIVAIPALSIDVSAGNVQTKTISTNSTFTFTGWTANAASVVLELTAAGTETVTFTGATFKTAPSLAAGLNVFVFTSVDNGTTINGYISRDGA